MIKLLSELPDNVVGLTATGQVTGEDYTGVLIPAIEKSLETFDKIRLLYHLGPEFRKFTTTALWDDARVGLHHLTDFERVAVVTDIGWIATMVKGIGLTMPCEIRTFTDSELNDAREWISGDDRN